MQAGCASPLRRAGHNGLAMSAGQAASRSSCYWHESCRQHSCVLQRRQGQGHRAGHDCGEVLVTPCCLMVAPGLDVVWNPLNKVGAVLVLHSQHLVIYLQPRRDGPVHAQASAAGRGDLWCAGQEHCSEQRAQQHGCCKPNQSQQRRTQSAAWCVSSLEIARDLVKLSSS